MIKRTTIAVSALALLLAVSPRLDHNGTANHDNSYVVQALLESPEGLATAGATENSKLPKAKIVDIEHTDDDLICLATNTYFESRNDDDMGRIATAWTVLNRVDHPRWPNNVCDVVKQARKYYTTQDGRRLPRRNHCTFSWYCDGRPDKIYEIEVYNEIVALMARILEGTIPDPTEGATYYHTTSMKKEPWWVEEERLVTTGVFGKHVHYRLPNQMASNNE